MNISKSKFWVLAIVLMLVGVVSLVAYQTYQVNFRALNLFPNSCSRDLGEYCGEFAFGDCKDWLGHDTETYCTPRGENVCRPTDPNDTTRCIINMDGTSNCTCVPNNACRDTDNNPAVVQCSGECTGAATCTLNPGACICQCPKYGSKYSPTTGCTECKNGLLKSINGICECPSDYGDRSTCCEDLSAIERTRKAEYGEECGYRICSECANCTNAYYRSCGNCEICGTDNKACPSECIADCTPGELGCVALAGSGATAYTTISCIGITNDYSECGVLAGGSTTGGNGGSSNPTSSSSSSSTPTGNSGGDGTQDGTDVGTDGDIDTFIPCEPTVAPCSSASSATSAQSSVLSNPQNSSASFSQSFSQPVSSLSSGQSSSFTSSFSFSNSTSTSSTSSTNSNSSLSLSTSFSFSNSSSSFSFGGQCGNAIVEVGEQCDNGSICTGNLSLVCTQDADCRLCMGTQTGNRCGGAANGKLCTSHSDCQNEQYYCTYNTAVDFTCNNSCQRKSSSSSSFGFSSAFSQSFPTSSLSFSQSFSQSVPTSSFSFSFPFSSSESFSFSVSFPNSSLSFIPPSSTSSLSFSQSFSQSMPTSSFSFSTEFSQSSGSFGNPSCQGNECAFFGNDYCNSLELTCIHTNDELCFACVDDEFGSSSHSFDFSTSSRVFVFEQSSAFTFSTSQSSYSTYQIGSTPYGEGCVRDVDCAAGLCINNRCQVPTLTAASTLCGNGILESPEECDDSNVRDNDGCTSTCLLEVGICGDGIVQKLLGEQCEPSLHNPSLPYTCQNCRFASSLCGNGVVDSGEECDEGQGNSLHPNATCRPDCSRSRCGDGVLDSAELCDDGNTRSGDGCDRFCRTENNTQVAGVVNQQHVAFPTQNTTQPLPFQLPLANLQPLIQSQAPIGDTGPAAVAVIGAGAASGIAWVRRKRR